MSYDLVLFFANGIETAPSDRFVGVNTVVVDLGDDANTSNADAHATVAFTLHADKSMRILSVFGAAMKPRDVGHDTITVDLAVVHAREGLVRFSILFLGQVQTDLRGLYASKFFVTDEGGKQRTSHVLATHFEPTAARCMYPCVDEPAARAEFKLSVVLPHGAECDAMSVLSGALQSPPRSMESCARLSEIPAFARRDAHDWSHPEAATWLLHQGPPTQGGRLQHAAAMTSDATLPTLGQWLTWQLQHANAHFAVPNTAAVAYRVVGFDAMHHVPPYLTVLVIGEFDCREDAWSAPDGRTVPLRFFVARGRGLDTAAFSLSAAKFSLGHFTSLFGSPYPLPKLDLVAVPDFPIGGMENWGLICLVESVLLLEAKSSTSACLRTASLVCHEVSHNWFGNLVGIEWWDALWLKEGFATYCGYHAVDAWKPSWGANNAMVDEVAAALDTDGYRATHAVHVPIDDPADITQAFDAISYDKGMAIVRMLVHTLGDAQFTKGMSHYVATFANRNPLVDDLWTRIEEATGVVGIADAMHSYATLEGFPVVTVRTIDATTRKITLSAQKYRREMTIAGDTCRNAANSNDGVLGCPWTVPVTLSIVFQQRPPHGTNPPSAATSTASPLPVQKLTLSRHRPASRNSRDGTTEETFDLDSALVEVLLEKQTLGFAAIIVDAKRDYYYRVAYDDVTHCFDVMNVLPWATTVFRKGFFGDVEALWLAGRALPPLGEPRSQAGRHPIDLAQYLLQVARHHVPFSAMGTWIDGLIKLFGVISQHCKSHALMAPLKSAMLDTIIRPTCTHLGVCAWPSGTASTEKKETLTTTSCRVKAWSAWVNLMTTNDDVAGAPTAPTAGTDAEFWFLQRATELLRDMYACRQDQGLLRLSYDPAMAVPLLAAACRWNLQEPSISEPSNDIKPRATEADAVILELFHLYAEHAAVSRLLITTVAENTPSIDVFRQLAHDAMTATGRIRAQLGHIVIGCLCRNPFFAAHNMWPIFCQHFESVMSLWGNGQFRIQSICANVIETVHRCMAAVGNEPVGTDKPHRWVLDVEEFFKIHTVVNARLAILRGVESLHGGTTLRRVVFDH